MALKVRGTQRDDLVYVAENMRAIDRQELADLTGSEPFKALENSVRLSDYALTVCDNDVPLCVCGIARISMLSERGAPWLLGTDKLREQSRGFVLLSRGIFGMMSKKYEYLENLVSADNGRSIRWLKWLGFTVEAAKPAGISQKPFHRFYMEV